MSIGNWCLFPFSRQQGSGRGDAGDGPVSGSTTEGAKQCHEGCAFSVKYHLVALSLGEAHTHLCCRQALPPAFHSLMCPRGIHRLSIFAR